MNILTKHILFTTLVTFLRSSGIHSNNEKIRDWQIRNGKQQIVFVEKTFLGQHPCASDSICDCWYDEATAEISVDCSQRNLTELPKMYKGFNVAELDLSMNLLKQAADMTKDGYKLVRKVNLSGNRIKSVTDDLISPNLKALYLHNNLISRIDQTVLRKIFQQSNVTKLTLHDNPWKCDCDSLPLADFVHLAKLYPDVSNLTCVNTSIKLIDLRHEQLCPDGKMSNSPVYSYTN